MTGLPTASAISDVEDPAELGSPAYVVLGMVRLGARSGYEIKQTVELSIRFFWTISQAQIYPSLKRLEQAGLVEGRDEPKGKRPRRVYEITADGEAALTQWLRRQEPIPFELRDLGLVKLFFADALDPGDALSLLAAVQRRSKERVEALLEVESAAVVAEEHGNAHPLLTLHMGIAFHQAMLDVCQEFEQKLRPGVTSVPWAQGVDWDS
jgi:PadR family transcriptional regulator, regulatory protein AphA